MTADIGDNAAGTEEKTASCAARKKELRKQILARRNRLSKDEIMRKSAGILNILYTLAVYQNADIILAYVEYRSEVMTTPLIQRALSEGKMIYVPKVSGTDMDFYRIESLSALSEGYKGIKEPESAAQMFTVNTGYDSRTADTDKTSRNILMLMPGAVFDRAHHRIGYGMGFYDRYLERLQSSGITIHTAALCFACQMLDDIPYYRHDICPEMIITEEKIF